jgi:hypothetical protein
MDVDLDSPSLDLFIKTFTFENEAILLLSQQ